MVINEQTLNAIFNKLGDADDYELGDIITDTISGQKIKVMGKATMNQSCKVGFTGRVILDKEGNKIWEMKWTILS